MMHKEIMQRVAAGCRVNEIAEDDLYEMANVYPFDSGLPMAGWVRPRSNERPAHHGLHGPRSADATPQHSHRGVAADRDHPPGGLSFNDFRTVSAWLCFNEASITDRISAAEFDPPAAEGAAKTT